MATPLNKLPNRYAQIIENAVINSAMKNGYTLAEAKQLAEATLTTLTDQDIRNIFSDQYSVLDLLQRIKQQLHH